MKIGCPCGRVIYDQTDNLSDKAHLITDQEWFPTMDAIDKVIDDVIAKREDATSAYIAIRRITIKAARHVYQCRVCGRLFVDDQQRKLHPFVPASSEVPREILRSRDGDTHDA
jgi:hypothetical protein